MEIGGHGIHTLAIVQRDWKKEPGFVTIHLQVMEAISVSGTLQSLLIAIQHVQVT